MALWTLYGAEATAIFWTHARLSPAGELKRGRFDPLLGAAQVLTFVRHPMLHGAAAFVPIALARLPPSHAFSAVRLGLFAGGIGGLAAKLVAERSRLVIGPSDIVAVGGVTAVLAITVESARLDGVGPMDGWVDGDAARLAAAVSLLAIGLPWIMADLGVYVGDVPIVGAPFLSRELLPLETSQPAVHLGHHHGIDGVLLALTGLALSRTLARLRPAPIREGLSYYLAFLLVYGVARAAEDAWNEQVVKRGWTSIKLPLVVAQGRPTGRRFWGGMLIAAKLLHRRWFPRQGRAVSSPR